MRAVVARARAVHGFARVPSVRRGRRGVGSLRAPQSGPHLASASRQPRPLEAAGDWSADPVQHVQGTDPGAGACPARNAKDEC